MADRKRWVVQGLLKGGLFVRESTINLPVEREKVALTSYAILEQDLLQKPSRTIFLGLEIHTDEDHVCVAYQEMESFTRALAIEKNIPVTVDISKMTDKPEQWPEGIGFLEAGKFPMCSGEWQPVDHHEDPKNRVRWSGGFATYATTENLGPVLEERHQAFSAHEYYHSELVKDYLAGLDAERRQPSLAMLYFYKVLERVAVQQYGGRPKRAITTKTMDAMIQKMGAELTEGERAEAVSIRRWRHTKSEAHLLTEGMPTEGELRLSKKMARFFLDTALRA